MKKLHIAVLCSVMISCQNSRTEDVNPVVVMDTVFITDTIVKEAEEPRGMKIEPIIIPRDSVKAITLKNTAIDLLTHNGNLMDALTAIDEAIYHNPKDANAWYIRGNVYQKLVRYENALEDYKYTIELDPMHVDAIMKCAVLAEKTGDNVSACAYLYQACNLGSPEACKGVEKFCEKKY